jgi:hypothetical protein
LERIDERPVAEGASVLFARFYLCSKWDGLKVYARFKHMAAAYDVPLDDEGCAQIPWEVVYCTGFDVSIWGDDAEGRKLTSESIFIEVKRSIDTNGVAPLPSTPSQVEMFISKAAAAERAAAAAADSAEAAAETIAKTEEWEFTLEDGSTVAKVVCVK